MNELLGVRFVGDDELFTVVRETEKQLRQAQARAVEVAGIVERDGLAARHGYRSTAYLLRTVGRVSLVEAKRRVEQAHAIFGSTSESGVPLPAPLPRAGAAARAGEIGAEHLTVFAKVAEVLEFCTDDDHVAEIESTLLRAAGQLDGRTLHRVADRVRAHVDPDGRAPAEERVRENELRWNSRTGRGTFRLSETGAALFDSVLSPLAKPVPSAAGEADPRDQPERQGDALARMVEIVVGAPEVPSERGERPHIAVTVALADLIAGLPTATLPDDTALSAPEARRLACDAGIIPMVLGSSSEPLDVGQLKRLVTQPQRRLLTLRDKGCAFPGCPAPARWTEAHHIVPWHRHGPTDLGNLVLVCGQHHKVLHHEEWTVRIRNGTAEFVPPPHIDPQRRPRVNLAHATPGSPAPDSSPTPDCSPALGCRPALGSRRRRLPVPGSMSGASAGRPTSAR